ncbi:aldehyde dehydrogenase family protein [Nocardia sp. bgisy134]|uniref:aldehyde dehydrogenase family protein n=1 Tax=Nocardia sp. bgisy134 TaxID=3413789 RepID=UPI003D755CC5
MKYSGRTIADFALTVDGRDHPTSRTFDVINPATGQLLTTAPALDPSELDVVFGAAQQAFEQWKQDDAYRRQRLLEAADAIDAAAEDLVGILTAEQGKPLDKSQIEISSASMYLRYYADLDLPREVIKDDHEGYEEILHRPLGVVAAIAPWNFPITLAMWKIAPALRAGNTMVLKPSPYTPLSTLALGSVLRDILPPGVLNVISGPDPLGAQMVGHPVPRKVSFTGSTATGKKVAAAAADDLKRLTLELGGNDPAIVLDDIDIGKVAEQLFWSAFENTGQICLAVKRVYAHESVHAELVDALAEIAQSVKVDDGTVAGAQLGPINNAPQLDRVTSLVEDARQRGARIVAGGGSLDRPGYFFAPTIIDRVEDGVRIVDEEQFGPVLPVVAFRDELDAVRRANDSTYGLTASVWSGDPNRAARIGLELDTGQVSINSHGRGVRPHLPFGGRKWSGIGTENGIWGLRGFTEMQVITGPRRVS